MTLKDIKELTSFHLSVGWDLKYISLTEQMPPYVCLFNMKLTELSLVLCVIHFI